MPHIVYELASRTGPCIGLDLVHHALPVVFYLHELECAFGAKMPCDGVIVVAPEHLRTASASSWDVQLHSVVEETVILLPMALVLA